MKDKLHKLIINWIKEDKTESNNFHSCEAQYDEGYNQDLRDKIDKSYIPGHMVVNTTLNSIINLINNKG